MKTHLEAQISENTRGFELTVTLTSGTDYWTSKPARLDAEDWDGALAEATQQVRALRRILGNGEVMDENGPTTVTGLFTSARVADELPVFLKWMDERGYSALSYSNQMRLAEAWLSGYKQAEE